MGRRQRTGTHARDALDPDLHDETFELAAADSMDPLPTRRRTPQVEYISDWKRRGCLKVFYQLVV